MTPRKYSTGADMSVIPDSEEVPPLDIQAVLGVNSANPYLRAARIEHGILDPRSLPPAMVAHLPEVVNSERDAK